MVINPGQPQPATATHPAYSQQVWQWLFKPTAKFQDDTQRMRASALAAMSLGAALLQITLLVAGLQHPGNVALTGLLGLSLGLTVVIYGLSRTRYYQLGAALLIGCSFALMLIWLQVDRDPHEIFVLIIPILLASQFFLALLTAVLSAASCLIVIADRGGDFSGRFLIVAIFLSVVLALLLLANTTRDYTEKRLLRQHEKVTQNEARLRSILENMPIMLDAFDKNWTPLVWNKECERVTGYTAAEIIGNDQVMKLFTPNPEEHQQQMAELAQLGNYYRNWEANLTCKDGTVKRIAWSVIARDFPIAGWPIWGIGVDVTELHKAEQQRLELALERERVQLLQQFISDISHDLLTPITIMKSSLYLLSKPVSFEKWYEHVQQIEAQTDRLQNMIQDILTMSRLDKAFIQEFNFWEQNLNLLVQELIKEHQLVADAQHQTLEQHFQPDLPLVCFDYAKLRQALNNILENALRYTPDGGHICVTTGLEPNAVFVEVRDSGAGIAPADLPHIFERFYRGETYRPTDGGAGLGLAIAQKIVQAHNGIIRAQSEPGQGAIFRITLPLVAETQALPA
ncbi:MAG TPA: PAS domain-containing sensor histidine kinase [Phototrophicaceae bacterium]|nr:PAS domain-containing sensor histidine kinase [Phototrophicaceae bacterium]